MNYYYFTIIKDRQRERDVEERELSGRFQKRRQPSKSFVELSGVRKSAVEGLWGS